MSRNVRNEIAPTREELGKRLRMLREAAGYSNRVEIAAALGIPRTTYANYEYGACSLSHEVIWDLCVLLKITPNELLGFDEVDDERLVLHEKLNALGTEDPDEIIRRAMAPNAESDDALLAVSLLVSRNLHSRASRKGKEASGK